MNQRLNSRTITGRLVEVFRREGFDGASLTVLARGAGLGRASFYHHFPGGKADMARAAYERASRDFTRAVLAPLAGSATPAERLQRMVNGLDAFYDGGRGSCLIDVFSLGGARALFRTEIAEALAYWAHAIARVLIEAGIDPAEADRRAENVIIAVEGALVMCRGSGRTEPFRRVLEGIVPALLEGRRARVA
jgi:AcrR family transcriptional regulator